MQLLVLGSPPPRTVAMTRPMIRVGTRPHAGRACPRPDRGHVTSTGRRRRLASRLVFAPLDPRRWASRSAEASPAAAWGHTGGTLDKLRGHSGLRTSMTGSGKFWRRRSEPRRPARWPARPADLGPADGRALYALRDATATVASIPADRGQHHVEEAGGSDEPDLILPGREGGTDGAFMKTPRLGRRAGRRMRLRLAAKWDRPCRAAVFDGHVPAAGDRRGATPWNVAGGGSRVAAGRRAGRLRDRRGRCFRRAGRSPSLEGRDDDDGARDAARGPPSRDAGAAENVRADDPGRRAGAGILGWSRTPNGVLARGARAPGGPRPRVDGWLAAVDAVEAVGRGGDGAWRRPRPLRATRWIPRWAVEAVSPKVGRRDSGPATWWPAVSPRDEDGGAAAGGPSGVLAAMTWFARGAWDGPPLVYRWVDEPTSLERYGLPSAAGGPAPGRPPRPRPGS
jgi:hypothetical protein